MKQSDRMLASHWPIGVAAALGISMLANGMIMLADPWLWYTTVPGVGRTGLFNQHFIRDIGTLYAAIGGAFVIGAMRPTLRVIAWAPATLWLTAHALFHFWEVGTGVCAPSYLITDFPAVSLPSLISIALTFWAWRASSMKSSQAGVP